MSVVCESCFKEFDCKGNWTVESIGTGFHYQLVPKQKFCPSCATRLLKEWGSE